MIKLGFLSTNMNNAHLACAICTFNTKMILFFIWFFYLISFYYTKWYPFFHTDKKRRFINLMNVIQVLRTDYFIEKIIVCDLVQYIHHYQMPCSLWCEPVLETDILRRIGGERRRIKWRKDSIACKSALSKKNIDWCSKQKKKHSLGLNVNWKAGTLALVSRIL